MKSSKLRRFLFAILFLLTGPRANSFLTKKSLIIRRSAVMKKMFVLLVVLCVMFPISAFADWGAIAADETLGDADPAYGFGGGDTEKEAKKNAMKFCKEAGGEQCKVAVTYKKCGSYAASKKYSGAGSGATREEAKKNALQACGNPKCKIIKTDCND
jgi:hypothetical protein